MVNKGGVIGDSLGQVGSLVKDTAKQLAKVPKDAVKTTVSQLGFEKTKAPEELSSKANSGAISEEERKKFVKGLYGISDQAKPTAPDTSQENTTPGRSSLQDKPFGHLPGDQDTSGRPAEEEAKMAQLRQQLHKETYYQPLVNRPKTQEEVERPAEKVEREKMEELQVEQEKQQKKPKLIAVDDMEHRVERGGKKVG